MHNPPNKNLLFWIQLIAITLFHIFRHVYSLKEHIFLPNVCREDKGGKIKEGRWRREDSVGVVMIQHERLHLLVVPGWTKSNPVKQSTQLKSASMKNERTYAAASCSWIVRKALGDTFVFSISTFQNWQVSQAGLPNQPKSYLGCRYENENENENEK